MQYSRECSSAMHGVFVLACYLFFYLQKKKMVLDTIHDAPWEEAGLGPSTYAGSKPHSWTAYADPRHFRPVPPKAEVQMQEDLLGWLLHYLG